VLPEGQFGKVKRIPSAVKGRRAHPPKPEKKLVEGINKKEYRKALLSAIAMSARSEVVSSRYKSKISLALPIILEDSFEKLAKTKDVSKVISALKLEEFLVRARQRGTKSTLVVVSGGDVLKAARNLPGVDVVSVDDLKVKHLAPGTHPGRLTLYSEAAISKISQMGDVA
jgi:large subunit ribosomal protein L4e